MKKFSFIVIISVMIFTLSSCIREDNSPVKIPLIDGAVLTLNEVADPAEKNQFWIELSSSNVKKNHREAWDLGFYSGDEFRVMLNSSLAMSVGKIQNVTDMNAVNSQTVANLKPLVQVANFSYNSQYIDNPNGQLLTQTTGIAEINADENLNNVYLLNMGYKTYSGTTVPGTVYTMGDARGWKKIRILKHQQGYKIQYADLDDTTFQEFVITKDPEYNFKFFSLTTGNYADIQPKKKNWDLCFTVFTNLVTNPANNLPTSYVFPDVITHNTLGKVAVYEVKTENGQGETAFNNFKKENVDTTKFVTNDQRTIGSSWRTTTGSNGAEVFSNKFYILRNSDGFFFKIRFLRMKSDDGNRGYPQFEYKAL